MTIMARIRATFLVVISLLVSSTRAFYVPHLKVSRLQCESKKSPLYGFLKFFPELLGIFNQFFTHLLYDFFYTRLQIFIQISPILTKLYAILSATT